MFASFVAFAISVLYALLIVVQYVFFGVSLPSGLSFLSIAMLLLFSVLYFGIGIVGIYLQRLLDESLDRPLFVIAQTTDENPSDVISQQKDSFNVRRD